MHELTRRVRFCVEPGTPPDPAAAWPNTFAGAPAMTGLGAYYELDVACRGEPDPDTGYLVDIGTIDRCVRAHAAPVVARALGRPAPVDPRAVLTEIVDALGRALDRPVAAVRWHLTPYYSLAMSPDKPDRILIRQQFEFSAAHRLHCPDRSDAENRRIFGRCNNPNGHGHNYRLEVAASTTLDGPGPGLDLARLETLVRETVVDRFDHTHLNLDTDEFAELNPSVEHIARVCHALLADPVRAAGGCLEQVTVWETEKTSCTYPAG